MPRLAIALIVTLATTVMGCGRSPEPPGAAPNADPAAAAAGQTALVDRARIEGCAGFTAEKAAAILGTPAAALEAKTSWSEELQGQMCRYWSPESLIGPGLQFLLESEASASQAAARMASLREGAPAADAAIRDAVGKTTPGKALMIFEDIGDEAMWDPLTTGVSLRVANVVASIQASPSRSLVTQKDADVIELERQVAEEVARGLRAR